jgi:pSer/pThr/pTyr-binding forkhead associated (FHA) protein
VEGGLDNAFDRAAGAVFRGPIQPAQIAKRAEKQMNRYKLVGAGKQHAPTLYTVLVNPNDDRKLFAFYPTMASEIETFLMGKGSQNGLRFDGRPLVRFIVDGNLKSGKFEVIAENVAAPIIEQLREEEMVYYGLKEPKRQNSSGLDIAAAGVAGAGAGSGGFGSGAGGGAVGAGAASGAAGVGFGAAAAAGAGGAAGAAAVGAGAAMGAAAAAGNNAAMYLDAARPARPETDLRMNDLPNIQPAMPAAAATPSVIGQARLIDINAGKGYPLRNNPTVIGRDDSCDITVDDANVSRNHAQLTQDVVGTWKLTDLGSTNGSKLNGSRVTTALLRDGDELTFGVTVLEYREL